MCSFTHGALLIFQSAQGKLIYFYANHRYVSLTIAQFHRTVPQMNFGFTLSLLGASPSDFASLFLN